MPLADVIQAQPSLTATERRLAEIVMTDSEAVAFGTVAAVARAAETSGASVVRFANRLGFDGFVGLQAAVRDELTGRLRPAVERIRQPGADNVIDQSLEVEVRNVTVSVGRIDRRALTIAVNRLASPRARVIVLPGSASFGVGHHLAEHLGLLRDGVTLAAGSPASVIAALATATASDTVVAIDVARYDATVVDGMAVLEERRVPLLAITDSPLSPLGRHAKATFTISSDGAGPFDSQIGAMAVANVLVAAVARRLRATATRRLDRVERGWRAAGVLADS